MRSSFLESWVADWFHVHDGCPVEGFQVPHADLRAVDCSDVDPVQADGVGPVGRAGAEHSSFGIGEVSGMRAKDITAASIQPGEHDDVGAALKVTQTVTHDRIEH